MRGQPPTSVADRKPTLAVIAPRHADCYMGKCGLCTRVPSLEARQPLECQLVDGFIERLQLGQGEYDAQLGRDSGNHSQPRGLADRAVAAGRGMSSASW
jgi:hypothetical protein